MTDQAIPLPIGLKAEDVPHIEVQYGLYSSKTGSGVEELSLLGTGRVVLRRTASYNAPEERLEGALPVAVVLKLLELFDDQRFFGMDEQQHADHPGLRRIVTVKTPHRSKSVAVDNDGDIPFERCVSALLFAGSLGHPQVAARRFFQLMGPI